MQRRVTAAKRVLLSSGFGSRSFSQAAAPLHEAEVPRMPAFDYTPPPYSGPSSAEILAKRKEFLSPSIFHFYKNPVSFLRRAPLFLLDYQRLHFLYRKTDSESIISCSSIFFWANVSENQIENRLDGFFYEIFSVWRLVQFLVCWSNTFYERRRWYFFIPISRACDLMTSVVPNWSFMVPTMQLQAFLGFLVVKVSLCSLFFVFWAEFLCFIESLSQTVSSSRSVVSASVISLMIAFCHHPSCYVNIVELVV